jgi:Zn-dependent M28 family amino/carboxypeptidase
MLPIAIGPVLGALASLSGSRGLAALTRLLCGGIIASFAHIAASETVPGANDNLTGVATLLEVARTVAERPVSGLRILFVSTGAEESLMEGMRAFAEHHFGSLRLESTYVLCVDAVGSPHLVLVEAEGMLEVRHYDQTFKDLIARCASEAEIPLIRGYTMRLGTDGYIALRHGLPAACLMSVDDKGVCANYHWPTDTPDRVDYRTLEHTVALCEAVVRRLGGDWSPPRDAAPLPIPP